MRHSRHSCHVIDDVMGSGAKSVLLLLISYYSYICGFSIYSYTGAFFRLHRVSNLKHELLIFFSCSSHVGWQGNTSQEITLGYFCKDEPLVIIHQILHALGLYHETNRADRNENVEIMWENIIEGMFLIMLYL